MKKCKNCKHEKSLVIDGAVGCPFEKICQKYDKVMYRPVWWKFWAAK